MAQARQETRLAIFGQEFVVAARLERQELEPVTLDGGAGVPRAGADQAVAGGAQAAGKLELEEIDFLNGNDAYKQDWMSERRQRWSITLFKPHSTKGIVERLVDPLKTMFLTH